MTLFRFAADESHAISVTSLHPVRGPSSPEWLRSPPEGGVRGILYLIFIYAALDIFKIKSKFLKS